MNNQHNAYNMHNIVFAMRLNFESHIPKNVVDQMNYILVQDIHLLDDSTL